MKERWTQQRLERLFKKYNRTYWHGRLPQYRVINAGLSKENAIGYCYRRERKIEIDVEQHRSDRHVRQTLLHEMAHAAAKEYGHGLRFFAQMERLMRLGAPVSVGSPEAGSARILDDIVPRRFPLLREKMQHAENRRERHIREWMRKAKVKSFILTDDMIVGEFEDAGDVTWMQALRFIGRENGLTDELGRPKNAWARRIVTRARRVHRRVRRDHLQGEKHWRGILGQTPLKPISKNTDHQQSNGPH